MFPFWGIYISKQVVLAVSYVVDKYPYIQYWKRLRPFYQSEKLCMLTPEDLFAQVCIFEAINGNLLSIKWS